ncbi:flavin reductase family protein [Streptomyces sp. NPDC048297]|uniref:flavin reductase family protein n=1 Tax=Streptomyces sp. NPDC048297 TaxID=3365531 RepID=UPI00371A85D1
MSTAFTDCMSMSPMVNLAGYGVEADHFRSLAAALPTGVSVVTTLTADGAPVGMTSGAVCGLSCEPPLVLVCIARGSRTLREIKGRRSFCVNVLASGADALSNRFASAGGDKFTGVDWRPGPGGVPVLSTGTTAHAVCELYQIVPGGDHEIVIGLIVAGDSDPSDSPLVYYRRTYAGFDALA